MILSFLISVILMNARPLVYMLATPEADMVDVYSIGVVSLYCYFIFLIMQSLGFCLQNKIALEKRKSQHWLLLKQGFTLAFAFNFSVFITLLVFKETVFDWMRLEQTPEVMAFVWLRFVALFFESIAVVARGYFSARVNQGRFFYSVVLSFGVLIIGLGLQFYGQVSTHYLYSIGWIELFCGLVSMLYCIYALLPVWKKAERVGRYKNSKIFSSIFWQLLQQTAIFSSFGLLDHFGTVQMYGIVANAPQLFNAAIMHFVFNIQGFFPGLGMGIIAMSEISKAIKEKKSNRYVAKAGYDIVLRAVKIFSYLALMVAVGLYACDSAQWLDKKALFGASLLSIYIMLLQLPFHVASQVAFKCLQAIDRGSSAISTSLASVYFLRLPLFLAVSYFALPVHYYWLALMIEKIIRVICFGCIWANALGNQKGFFKELFFIKIRSVADGEKTSLDKNTTS